MIDLDQLKPDWALAQAHSKATRPGKKGDIQKTLRCPCCFQIIDKTPIGICRNSKQLQPLGFGFPLYFKFLKYTILMMILQVISYNALALYWSYEDNISFCRDNQPKILGTNKIDHCTGLFVSLARIQYTITPSQQIIRVGSFIIQMLALIYIRDKLTKTNSYYDQITTSMSDYSIIIKDIPSVINIQEKLRKMFMTFFTKSINIEEMIVIGHLTEFYSLEHDKKKLIQKKKKALSKKQVDEDQVQTIDFQIQQNESMIDEQINKQINNAYNDTLICEKVIITLQSDPIKEFVIKQFAQKMKDSDDIDTLRQIFADEDANMMKIMQAPQPNQITWENININRRQRWIKQINGWILTVLLIGVITVIIFFLLRAKANIVDHQIQALKNSQNYTADSLHISSLAIVYCFIFAVIFTNKFIISPVLHHIAEYQKHPTKDKQEYSYGLKYTLCLFFTTALMTLVVEDITLHNIYLHDFGVIEEESIMFFVNAFFVPLLWLINPWYIYRLIMRKRKMGSELLTQRQANQIMEDMPVSLGKWYGQIIQTVWFTYIYATIIPLGAIVTVFGMIFFYWVAKINLLTKCSSFSEISGKMCLKALKLLDITLMMRPIGSLIFDFQIKNSYTIQSIVCLVIALIYIITPIDKILKRFHGEEFLLQEKTYQQVKDKFVSNYKNLHPIISRKKMYLQNQLSNLSFFSFKDKMKKKISKKVIMTIQMSLFSPQKWSPNKSQASNNSTIKQILM